MITLEEAINQIPFLATPPEVWKRVDEFLSQRGISGYLNGKFEILLAGRKVIEFMSSKEAAIADDYFLTGIVVERDTAASLYCLCCALKQKPATFLST